MGMPQFLLVVLQTTNRMSFRCCLVDIPKQDTWTLLSGPESRLAHRHLIPDIKLTVIQIGINAIFLH